MAEIYYAIKANPALEIVAALEKLGTGFDLASLGEPRPAYLGCASLLRQHGEA